jgi:hypothetical protein
MGDYGAASELVHRLIERAGALTNDEAADLYEAYTARILIDGSGSGSQRAALLRARRAAGQAGLQAEYEHARQAAATAWRRALPHTQGPWLVVGAAIGNAAGALVVQDVLDDKLFQVLIGPWRQAIGMLTPVGPGVGSAERSSRALTRTNG